MTFRLRYWWPAIAYAAFIFVLSSVPKPPFLGDVDLNDKAKHLLLYAVFAVFVWRGAAATASRPRAAALLTVVILSAWGASDEFHQLFVPGRSCDWRDWVADTVAGVVVVAAALWRQRRTVTAEAPARPA